MKLKTNWLLPLLSISLGLATVLKLGESEFAVKKGANFNFQLPNNDYFFIETDYSLSAEFEPARFCSVTQPEPSLTVLRKLDLDFPNRVRKESLLFFNNYVLMTLSNGSLLEYEVIFSQDNSSIDSLRFVQETPYLFNRSLQIINETVIFQQDSKLLFADFTKQFLLVCNHKIHVFGTDLSSPRLLLVLNRSIHLNGSVTNIELYSNFLYLVLNFTTLEIYDLRDFFQYTSISISTLLQPIPNNALSITDLTLSEEFLIILESSTGSCFFFDRLGLVLRNTLFFNGTVKLVRTKGDTVLVYYLGPAGEMFLKEFQRFNRNSNYYLERNVFEMKAVAKAFDFLENRIVISTHENLVTFIRYSVDIPKNLTAFLKKTLAFEGIELVASRVEIPALNLSNMSKSWGFEWLHNTLIISTSQELQFLKLIESPGTFSCLADDSVPTKKYEMSLNLYYFNCSCPVAFTKTDRIRVVLAVYQELFESSNIALAIGLGIGFSLAFIIMIVFCVYFYRIKHHYTTLVKEISPQEGKPKMLRPLNKKGSEGDQAEEKTEGGHGDSMNNNVSPGNDL